LVVDSANVRMYYLVFEQKNHMPGIQSSMKARVFPKHTGAAPNQQIEPSVDGYWCHKESLLAPTTFFFRTANNIIKAQLAAKGGVNSW